MERGIIGADVAIQSITPLFTLGTTISRSGTTYRYVKAGSSNLTAYRFCIINPVDYRAFESTTTNAGVLPMMIGVPQINMTADYFGWIATAGSFTGYLAANCVSYVKLYTTATLGLADDSATTLIRGVQATTTVGGASANTVCFSPIEMAVNCS